MSRVSSGREPMDDPLFVYGPLRAEHAPASVARVVGTLRRLGPARVRGRLYDLGPHPAGVPDAAADGWIEGELVALGPGSPPLAWFDAYEGFDPDAPDASLFRRERALAVDARGRSVACWIYAFARSVDERRLLPGGRWPAPGTA